VLESATLERKALQYLLTYQPVRKALNGAESKDVHFGINWNWAANHSNAARLCTKMTFLKDRSTAENGLSADPDSRKIFTLEEVIDSAFRL
jgi:ABC-type proline/glycine betaine transport system substrate-binding protein